MANDLFTIQQPWNLESDIQALPNKVEPLPQLPKINTPAENLGIAPVDPKDFFKSMMEDSYKRVNSKKDPYESRFEKASLSDRYAGKSVSFGDYKLDPKSLDARYSKTQSWGEQAFNNLKVGLANGGSMFLIGMLGLPDLINNIKSGITGEAVEQSALMNGVYDWRQSVQENNSNFLSEQDLKTDAWNTIKNVVLPGFVTGSSQGWGSVFENLMYGVGAGASIAAQELLVSAIAPGLGNVAVLNNAAKMLNNINSIRKYAGIMDKIIDTSNVLRNVAESLGGMNKIKNAARYAYGVTIGANGEAAFEGIEGERNLSRELVQKYTAENGHAPTGKELDEINRLSKEAGSARYWANMGLLIGTNGLQFKRLFRNIDLAKESVEQLAKQGLKTTINKDGKVVAGKLFELKSDWWNRGFQKNLKPVVETVGSRLSTDFAKESFSEGFEEFSQTWIDKSVNSYYTWKLDHRGQPGISQALKSITEGFTDSFNHEGLQAFLSGAIAGVGQQLLFSLPNAPSQIRLSKQRRAELEKTLSTYNNLDVERLIKSFNINSIRGTVTDRAERLNLASIVDEVAEGAEQNNDRKIYKDLESLTFFDMAEPYVSRGHANILKQQFEYALDKMSDSDVAELFGNNNLSKPQAIAEFNKEVDKINASYSRIKQGFKNPFPYNPNDLSEQTKNWMFDNKFIPELAYLDYRVGELKRRGGDIRATLDPYYNDLKFFADESTLNIGRSYINQKIKKLQESENYLRMLSDREAGFKEDYVKEGFLVDKFEESIKLLDEYQKSKDKSKYEDFLDNYHEGFTIEHDMEKSGFYDRDEVMQKLSDLNRINSDLDIVQSMLKGYLSKDGFELFNQSYVSLANRELRKRELFAQSEESKQAADSVKEKYPNLSEEEVHEVVTDSTSQEEVMKKASEKNAEITVKQQKIEDTKTKVREKFITAGKGDLVEDFIADSKISANNQNRILEYADEFLKNIDDADFSKFKEDEHKKFINSIRKLSGGFDDGGFLDTNQSVYDKLLTQDKIKYGEAVIDFYKRLKTYKNLPSALKTKYNKYIKEELEIIKLLKAIPQEDDFVKVFTHHTITKEGDEFTVFKIKENGGVVIGKFNNYQDALDLVESEEMLREYQNSLQFEEENNLENKAENEYYDPQTFDKNGNRIVDHGAAQDNKSLKAALYNKISQGRTNEEINQNITENAIFTRYTVGGSVDGSIEIFESNDVNSGQLEQEKILRSLTTDAVVMSYRDDELGIVPLNTFKDPINGLGFMNANVLNIILGAHPRKSEIINFIGDRDYFQFLMRSTVDPWAYRELQAGGFLKFKGTPQDQIDDIMARKKIFNDLMNLDEQAIKEKYIFERVYTGIPYKDKGNYSPTEVTYPFALLKEPSSPTPVNQYTYFFIKENVKVDSIESADIDFVGLSDEFKEDARSKINQSYKARFNPNYELFRGYYTLITDSDGRPSNYKLQARQLSTEDFYQHFKDTGFSNIAVVSSEPNIQITYSLTEQRFNISDSIDDSKLFFKHPIKSVKDVESISNAIYKNLSKVQNWFKEGEAFQKSYDTSQLSLTLNLKSETKPGSVNDILATRLITDIRKNNYMVSKIVPKVRDVTNFTTAIPVEKEVVNNYDHSTVSEEPIPETPETVDVIGVAKQMGYNIPYFINTDEIGKFVSGVAGEITSTPQQLTKAIILAYAQNESRTDKPFYLNDALNLKLLDTLAQKENKIITASLKKDSLFEKLNLFTDRIPYKSGEAEASSQDIEQRVQELIKNCIR